MSEALDALKLNLRKLNDIVEGRWSYTNMRPTVDAAQVAVMDAMEAVKVSAAVQAFAAVANMEVRGNGSLSWLEADPDS